MRTFNYYQEKEEYKRKVTPKVLLYGILWLLPLACIGETFNQEWVGYPMVAGFIAIVWWNFIKTPTERKKKCTDNTHTEPTQNLHE